MLSTPMDLGPMGAQARGNDLDRLQASSKIKNLVVTTGSNNWYRELMVKKAKPDKKYRTLHMARAPRCVTKGEIVGVQSHIM